MFKNTEKQTVLSKCAAELIVTYEYEYMKITL